MIGPIVMVLGMGLEVSMSGHAQSSVPPMPSARADELVQELRQFPAGLPAGARSDVIPDLGEERRRRVHNQLRALGAAALPALSRGLADPDVRVRRNVAFFLGAEAGSWRESRQPRLDIRPCLPALVAALGDSDARVRELAAQVVGAMGSNAAAAVPALIGLLKYPDEGSRISACIGLTGIGPNARDALPALRQALSDLSAGVRRFAQRGIDTIQTQ